MNDTKQEPNFNPPDPALLEKHWNKFDIQSQMFERDLIANAGQPRIIAIHGLAGSGKSTMTGLFQKAIRESVVISLAGPLKNAAASLGWRGEKDEKGRKLLQMLGTEIVQDLIDKNRWTKMWVHGAHSVRFCKLILCDDLRFPAELAMFKRLKATTIKITGRGGLTADAGKHRSEQGLKTGFKYVYNNVGNLKDMELFVDQVLKGTK